MLKYVQSVSKIRLNLFALGACLCLLSPGVSLAQIFNYQVGPAGTGSPFTTISNAIQAINANSLAGATHVVTVLPGTYQENFTAIAAGRNVTFLGPQANNSPNTGSPRNPANSSTEAILRRSNTASIFSLNSNVSITFKGFVFDLPLTTSAPGLGWAITANHASNALGSAIHLEHNIFTTGLGAAANVSAVVYANNAGDLVVDDNKFQGITSGTGTTDFVYAENVITNSFTDNVILNDPGMVNSAQRAFYINNVSAAAHTVLVKGNKISGTRRQAISLTGTPADINRIQDNEIYGFSGIGIAASIVHNLTIANNIIRDNIADDTATPDDGLYLYACQATDVSANSIRNMRGAGIRVEDEVNLPNRNLMIHHNDVLSANLANDAIYGAGISLYSRFSATTTNTVYVQNNVIRDCLSAGVLVAQRSILEATGNSANLSNKNFRVNHNVFLNNGGGPTGTAVRLNPQHGTPGQIDLTANWWGGSDAIGPNGATGNILNAGFGQRISYGNLAQENVGVYSPWLGGPTNPDLDAVPGFNHTAAPHTYFGIPFQQLDPASAISPLVPTTAVGGVNGVINRAISHAKSGDVIEMWGLNPSAGLNQTSPLTINDIVYRENIVIPDNFGSLIIRSTQNKDNAFNAFSTTAARSATGNQEAILFQPTGGAGLTIGDGNNVTINGFKFVSSDNQAVKSMGGNTQLTFVNNLVEVVQLTTTPQLPTRNLVSTGVVSIEGHGLPLTLAGNYFRMITGANDEAAVGVFIRACSQVNIQGNAFNGSATGLFPGNTNSRLSTGLRLAGCNGATEDAILVRNNMFHSMRQSGFAIVEAPGIPTANVRFEYNEVIGNNGAGSNAHAGILLAANNASNLHFNNNVISNNVGNGILIPSTVNAGGKKFVLNYNLLSGNTVGMTHSGSGVVDAAGNWWGRNTGPIVSTNRNNAGAILTGTGAQQLIGANVSYSPWLAHPATTTAGATNSPDDAPTAMGFQNTSAKAYYVGILTAGPVPPYSTEGFVQRAADLSKDGDIIFFHDDDYINGAQPGAPANVNVKTDLVFQSVSGVSKTKIGSIAVQSGKQVRIANDFEVINIDLVDNGDGSIITFLPPLTTSTPASTVKTLFFTGWVKEGSGGRYVIGNLQTTRFVGTIAQYFGNTDGFPYGIGFHIVPSAGATALNQWTVTRSAGTNYPASPGYVFPPYTIGADVSIDRAFKVTYVGANPDAGWNASIAWLPDNDNDPGGVFPKQLNMRHSLNGGITWPTLQPTFTVPDTDPRVLGPVAINTTNFQFKEALYTVMRGCQIIADAGSDVEVCANFSAQLNASAQAGSFPSGGTYTYSWSPSFGLNNTTIKNPMVNLPVPGTFNFVVTATDAVGCSASDTVSVFVRAQVKATLSGGASICPGESATYPIVFEGSGPWTFTYTRNGSNLTTVTTAENPYNLTVTPPTTPGTYTYALTSVFSPLCGNGIASGQAFALVKPKPTATIGVGTPSTVCLGDQSVFAVQLTGTAPWSFTYLENGTNPKVVTNIFSSPYTLSATPTALGARTYTIASVNDGTTCDNVGSGSPTVNVIPGINSASISGSPAAVCLGQPVTFSIALSGNGPWKVQYAENGGAATEISGITSSPYTLTVTPSGLGMRNFTLTSVTGSVYCTGGTVSGVGSVMVNPAPTADLAGNTISTCPGQTATFDVTFSGIPPFRFAYRENDGTPQTVSGITSSVYTLNVTPTGIGSRVYTLVSVGDATCNSGFVSGTTTVIVNPTPTTTLSGSTTIGLGSTASLNVSFTGSAPYTFTYRVNSETPVTVSGITTNPYVLEVTPSALGTYNYVLISGNDAFCSGTVAGFATVTVGNTTNCTLTSQLPIKINDGSASIVACGSVLLTPSTPTNSNYSYQWRRNDVNISGATARTYIATTAGTYTLRINETGCTAATSLPVSVVVNPGPNLVVNATSVSVSGASDGKIEATATTSAGQTASFEYRITGPVSTAYQASNTFNGLPAGEYVVFAREVGSTNCEVSKSATVGVQVNTTAPTLTLVDGSITINRATLSWTTVSGAIAYTLQYRVVGATTWTEVSNITATSRIVTGLQVGTAYEARVRSSATGSPWSNLLSFTTSGVVEACGRPTGIYVNMLSNNTSAEVNWTSVSTSVCYDLEYRVAAGSWVSVSPKPQAGSTSYTLTGLTPNTSYQVRMRSNCVSCPASTSNLSVYSATITFVSANTVNKDGESVMPLATEDLNLSVYPNPSKGAFTLSFDATVDGTAALEVLDLTGRTVFARTIDVQGGKNDVAVDLSGQAAGIYLLQLKAGETVQTLKVVLQ